jgi:hypothetical protein
MGLEDLLRVTRVLGDFTGGKLFDEFDGDLLVVEDTLGIFSVLLEHLLVVSLCNYGHDLGFVGLDILLDLLK